MIMIAGLVATSPALGAEPGGNEGPLGLATLGSAITALLGMGLGAAGALDLLAWLGRMLTREEGPTLAAGRDDHALTFLRHEDHPGGHCPVCARTFAAEGMLAVRTCNRCHVPMHPECWSYQGGCAIFGCRGEAAAAGAEIREAAGRLPAPVSLEPHPGCR